MIEQDTWVELLGVSMAGAGEPDQGLIWTGLDGWRGLPPKRGETSSIPGEHGRFRRRKLWRDSRVLTLTGHIYADDNAALVAAADRLEDALGEGIGEMRVSTSTGGIWSRDVEIDTLRIDPDRGRRWTKFIIDMVAPDPRRYGPLQTVGPASLPRSVGGVRLPQRMPWNFGSISGGSRLFVPNDGALEMCPVFRVSGGFSSVSIADVGSGRRLRMDWSVDESQELVVDCARRRAEVGGVDVTRWLGRREWMSVAPDSVSEFRFEAVDVSGDPLLWADFKIGAW